jgi:hypothetical protein
MQDYAIQRSSRRCYATDRPFAAGERYYSAILQKGSDLVRRDFASENWPGPNADMIGWWMTVVPQRANQIRIAPPHVLVDTLEALQEMPGKGQIAYLLALQLLRKRILIEQPSGFVENDATNVLSLRFAPDDREFTIPIVELEERDMESLQSQLQELLYSEAQDGEAPV